MQTPQLIQRRNSLASDLLPRLRQRFAAPIAIIVLPLLAFWAERGFGEFLTGCIGPTLYALYILGLVAYAAVLSGRLSPSASSMAAGALTTGAAIAAILGAFGAVAALFILLLSLPWLGPPRSFFQRMGHFGIGLVLAAIVLSPVFTALALGKISTNTLRSCAARAGKTVVIVWAIVGVGLTIAAMSLAQKADAYWLAPRLRSFETNDIARWEQSLRDIKANWFCGHRRCLVLVCDILMRRFGRTSGESSAFASPFGFALEAPNVPPDLAGPFTKVYGYPVRQVYVVGD